MLCLVSASLSLHRLTPLPNTLSLTSTSFCRYVYFPFNNNDNNDYDDNNDDDDIAVVYIYVLYNVTVAIMHVKYVSLANFSQLARFIREMVKADVSHSNFLVFNRFFIRFPDRC